ncbi:selenocysteine-specific translation elongation factor [Sulfuriroseicoccus oceanibius]|uniref:Selenocysteine-specific translation elongation factor n=1 Tax=Sulfuriroseicoccus oceanibius TaxID=2707525 RepID=A0A6B3L7A6_9BACT|nr:selenocysteine-specific translation elongation factor [Sulfuriroseicoccus oceanibius]QQL44367.1 selenocysteine-specific translation elongation factor [Sulfuriroseicoccus oceanibius]
MSRRFILGTAGHIDHGKSSLVRALTNVDPDRLPEEKRRGMTIELGFAHLTLDDSAGDQIEVGIVDVPGHADFIKNMVAGAAAIDGVLLVVAADDGWMPQSEEHLQILEYLGVRRAVIALTKADLSEDPEFAVEMLRDDLQDSHFAESPIIPVSSTTGAGIATLRDELVRMIESAPLPRDTGKPRLPIDRAFSPTGVGTVVTGTLTRGTLSVGDPVILTPAGTEGSIRGIQNHNASVPAAEASMRTAINLSDIALASSVGKRGAARGQTLTTPRFATTTDTLDVVISRTARHHISASDREVKLGHLGHVHIHHAGSLHRARLVLDVSVQRQIEPGQSAIAQLRFNEPIHAFAGDRFLVRDGSQQHTIAGGEVLHPFGNRRWFHKEEYQHFLAQRVENRDDHGVTAETLVETLVHHDKIISDPSVLDYTDRSDAELNAAIDALESNGIALRTPNGIVDQQWWQKVAAKAEAEVDAFHEAKPELPGIPVLKLQKALGRAAGDDRIFHSLLRHLSTAGIERTGVNVHRAGYTPQLPPAIQPIAEKILQQLDTDPINPPTKKELATAPNEIKALSFLIRQGNVIELDDKCVISTAGYAQIKQAVVAFIEAQGPARAADLKTAAGTTRKIMMPALERLDADGITARDGDFRHLKAPQPTA